MTENLKINVCYQAEGIQVYRNNRPFGFYPPNPTQLRYFISEMAYMQKLGYDIEFSAVEEQAESI